MTESTYVQTVEPRVSRNPSAIPISALSPTTATATTPCNYTSNSKPTAPATATTTSTEAPQALPISTDSFEPHVTVTSLPAANESTRTDGYCCAICRRKERT